VTKLTPIQLKELAQFSNGIGIAWYTAGVISPFFLKFEGLSTFVSAFIAICLSLFFAGIALYLVRGLKE
jgi:hypothetical protein